MKRDNIIFQFQQINKSLAQANKILIASHENPDPDAIGSTLALHRLFKKQNKESLPYLPDDPGRNLNFLSGFQEIETRIDSFDPDLIFCLDYGDFKRLRLPERLFRKDIITIDHHLESGQRGQVKVIAPQFSSTSEIIYFWLKESGVDIDKEIATCLLAGIVADSGGFCHVSTTSETLKTVSQLLLKGALLQKICRQTVRFSDNNQSISKIWGKILSRIKTDRKSSLAYSWISADDFRRYNISPEDLAGIVGTISTISQANIALLLTEYEKGKIRGSLRSEPYKGKNVAQLAKSLGGGGHLYAAGFKGEGTIEEVLKKVINLIE